MSSPKLIGMPGFLVWTKKNHPQMYALLVREHPEVAQFDALLMQHGLGFDFSSLLDSIGSGVKSAASSIATTVTKYGPSLIETGSQIYTAQQKNSLLQKQLKLAKANAPMQDTESVSINPLTGAVQRVSSAGTFISRWGMPIAAAAGGLLLLIVLLKRRGK